MYIYIYSIQTYHSSILSRVSNPQCLTGMFGMSNQRETRGTFFMVESAPENREGPEVNEVADIFLD